MKSIGKHRASMFLAFAFLAPPLLAQQPQDPNEPSDPLGAVGLPAPGREGVDCVRVPLCPNGAVINGEAYAGNQKLWQSDFNAQLLKLVDVSSNCQVLTTCPTPGAISPSENTLLNGILYHYDFGTGLLYGINPSTCAVVSTCNPPGDDFAEGLTNDGTFLWKGDSTTLYKFNPTNCQIVSSCPNPTGDSADGLSFCGTYLVMLGYSGRIYQIDPTTCQVVSSCLLNQGAAGNGITSDRISKLFVDQSANIDQVDLGCNVQFGFPNFLDPSPCGPTNALQGSVGVPLSFQMAAKANTGIPGEFVTLDTAGLPTGASSAPALPLQGQPAQTTVNWTPAANQVGTTLIIFTATDQLGQVTTCVVTVNVGTVTFCDCPPPGPAPCGNNGLPGNGCNNSLGLGGANLSIDGNTLMVRRTQPGVTVIFVKGTPGPTLPFFDGLLCMTNLVRFGKTTANAGGVATAQSLGSGSYQAYYRDNPFAPPACGNNANATNAITF